MSEFNSEERMLWLFKQVHGDMGNLIIEVGYDGDGIPNIVCVMKEGEVAWSVSRTQLLFEYITTKGMKEEQPINPDAFT